MTSNIRELKPFFQEAPPSIPELQLDQSLEPQEKSLKDAADELVCRFLVNLPEQERVPPRLFYNIKEACWFYVDNYCPSTFKWYTFLKSII